MTLNKDQSKHQNDHAYNSATQAEISDVLASDGPLLCHQVASRIGKTPQETRWHLTEIVARGEAELNWITGRYRR